MEGGFFTKIGISVAFVLLILTIGISFLTTGLNAYDISASAIETQFNSQVATQTAKSQEIVALSRNQSNDAALDEQVTDLAQLQGLVDAERTKNDYLTVFSQLESFVQTFLPFDRAIAIALFSILAIMAGSAVFFMWKGVNP